MYDINVGIVEILVFGAFLLGNYIKNKIDTRTRNKNVNDLLQGGVHLGIALYTIYNIHNNNNFNANLLQETNKMFAHYTKNINEMVVQVKTKLEELSEKNEKIVEVYKNIVEKTCKDNCENDLVPDTMQQNAVNMVQQTLNDPQYFSN